MNLQTGFPRIKEVFSNAGLAARREPDVLEGSLRCAFSGIWKQHGREYSVVLAQSPALSAKYRRQFLSYMARMAVPATARELEAEAECRIPLSGKEIHVPFGEVTLFLRGRDFIVVGIEDKTAAELEGKEHLRYDEYLRLRNRHPVLAFLSLEEKKLLPREAQPSDTFVSVQEEHLAGLADCGLLDWIHHSTGQFDQVLEAVSHYLDPVA
jgi:hypothetical protein